MCQISSSAIGHTWDTIDGARRINKKNNGLPSVFPLLETMTEGHPSTWPNSTFGPNWRPDYAVTGPFALNVRKDGGYSRPNLSHISEYTRLVNQLSDTIRDMKDKTDQDWSWAKRLANGQWLEVLEFYATNNEVGWPRPKKPEMLRKQFQS